MESTCHATNRGSRESLFGGSNLLRPDAAELIISMNSREPTGHRPPPTRVELVLLIPAKLKRAFNCPLLRLFLSAFSFHLTCSTTICLSIMHENLLRSFSAVNPSTR